MASCFVLLSLTLTSQKVLATEILTLKTHIEVQAETVTLADLFPNAKRYRSTPLFKSPPLGRQGTVGLEHLIGAAARYDFTFDTPLNLKNITVSRPARTIKQEVFETLLREKMKQHDHGGKSDNILTFSYDTPLTDQMVPLHLSGQVKLESFTFNKVYKTFRAKFSPINAPSRKYDRTLRGKVDFVGAGIPCHLNNLLTSGAPYNRVVNQKHIFAFKFQFNGIKFLTYRFFTLLLARHDKGAANVTIFNQALTEFYAKVLCHHLPRYARRIRNRDNHVYVVVGPFTSNFCCQTLALTQARFVN